MNAKQLSKIYNNVHNTMRNIDGLQPQEAFEELLKYLFFKQEYENNNSKKELTIKDIRKDFKTFLENRNSWSSAIWKDKTIHLTDNCLQDIHNQLFKINFSSLDYDIRSQALKEFLTPEIRKGLGIFLTPDVVVSTIVQYVKPKANCKVLDPSCGTGTFLIEYLKYVKTVNKSVEVIGFDKNPRMLLLADLNLGHLDNVIFNKKLVDTLNNTDFEKVDYIFTNPPFGISIDSRNYDFTQFLTCHDGNGYIIKKQTSEIVFIEKNLTMLKNDGTLSIVIPKSIATNHTLQIAREAIGQIGYIDSIISLPSETFATTGTQSSTLVLFIKKYKENEKNDLIQIPIANITNVGFDSTGRFRDGSQLIECAELMNKSKKENKTISFVKLSDRISKKDTFKELSNLFIKQNQDSSKTKLEDLCTNISTGKTPARKDYTENGSFIVKVGNLTGNGINWDARDRNFVNEVEIEKRYKSKKILLLKKFDILLTSSAHNPTYIAKKSDIFINIPEFLNENVSYSGEVMLLRPDIEKINPFTLLAFIRSSNTIINIQNMVRGQTAHLHAKDLMNLSIPNEIFEKDNIYERAGKLLERQSLLMLEINEINKKYNDILEEEKASF